MSSAQIPLNLLKQKIIEKIKREGPITFETFMEMALYEPGLGYYASDKAVIGRAGNFYTSQHLHPAFGVMIGRQLEEIWEIMGSPPEADAFQVVEIGAGAGYMCKDILNYLNSRELFGALTYVIVEPNPFMQYKQKKLLEGFSDKVKWVSSLQRLVNIRGCIFSNELLDAFPVHLIEMEDGLKEIYVTVDKDNNIIEIKGEPSTDALTDYINEFSIDLAKGYRTEVNLKIKDWLKSVNELLSEGFILTIDYGYPAWDYYSEDRNRGTLLCYHRHQVNENPYINIGEQDITAHVDFSSIKKWGEELGLKTIGFCHQGTFLIALGIDKVIQRLCEDFPRNRLATTDYLFEVAKIKGLILPGTIGESHKVMVQYKGSGFPELKGFSIRNQAGRL